MKKHVKIIMAVAIVLLVCAFFAFDLRQYLSFEFVRTKQEIFSNYYAGHAQLAIAIFMNAYIAITALSPPGVRAFPFVVRP